MNGTFRNLFRGIAAFEAFTWAGLLVGMAFKYLINGNELGVRIFGSLHGAAFVAYVVMVLLCARRFRWSFGVLATGIAASIPPFTTLIFDFWLDRRGMFEDREARLEAGVQGGSRLGGA